VRDEHLPVALVADVDHVVLAVGADAPRAEEPPPRPEPALLGERTAEDQLARPGVDVIVVA